MRTSDWVKNAENDTVMTPESFHIFDKSFHILDEKLSVFQVPTIL